jgi:hypothetical protein
MRRSRHQQMNVNVSFGGEGHLKMSPFVSEDANSSTLLTKEVAL